MEQQRRVWQVLFQTRGANAGVRELLNLEQLLDSCANWKYRDEASGTLHTAKCGRWDLMGLPDAMAGERLGAPALPSGPGLSIGTSSSHFVLLSASTLVLLCSCAAG